MKFPKIQEDEIFRLKAEFDRDPRTGKINGGIGIYLDQFGKPYVHPTVKLAIKKLSFADFNYLPLSGDPVFLKETTRLVLGQTMFKDLDPYIAKQGTVGGTNGIYMWARFIKAMDKKPVIIIGDPTWENHIQILSYFGFTIIKYPHLNKDKEFNITALKEKLSKNPKAYVLLQGGPTHNPTGINPDRSQWKELAKIVREKRQQVLFDYAYLGLGNGLDSDSFCIRFFIENKIPISVVVSYSKNMTLYQHRTGALLILTSSRREKDQTEKLLKYTFRLVNTNPPAFGEQIVKIILESKELTQRWKNNLDMMRFDLNKRRETFVKQTQGEFDFINQCRGLFGLLFLTRSQIKKLKEEYAIYLLQNSRINFGGLSLEHIPKVAEAVMNIL